MLIDDMEGAALGVEGVYLFAHARIQLAAAVWLRCKWCDSEDDVDEIADRWLALASLGDADDVQSETSWSIAAQMAQHLSDGFSWRVRFLRYRFPEAPELAARGLQLPQVISHMVCIDVSEDHVLTAANIEEHVLRREATEKMKKQAEKSLVENPFLSQLGEMMQISQSTPRMGSQKRRRVVTVAAEAVAASGKKDGKASDGGGEDESTRVPTSKGSDKDDTTDDEGERSELSGEEGRHQCQVRLAWRRWFLGVSPKPRVLG